MDTCSLNVNSPMSLKSGGINFLQMWKFVLHHTNVSYVDNTSRMLRKVHHHRMNAFHTIWA